MLSSKIKKLSLITFCLLAFNTNSQAYSSFNPFDLKEAETFYEGFNLALRGLEAKEFKVQGIDEEQVEFKNYMVVVDATDYDNAKRFAMQTIGFRYDDSVRVTFNNWIVISSFNRGADANTLARRINKKYLSHQAKNRRCFVYPKKENQIFYKEKSFYFPIVDILLDRLKSETKILYVKEKTQAPTRTTQTPIQNKNTNGFNYKTTKPLHSQKIPFELKSKFIPNNQGLNKKPLILPPKPNDIKTHNALSEKLAEKKLQLALLENKIEYAEKRAKQAIEKVRLANETQEKKIMKSVEDDVKKLKISQNLDPLKPLDLKKINSQPTKDEYIYTVILKQVNTMPVKIVGDIDPIDVHSSDLGYASSIPGVNSYISTQKLTTVDTQVDYYYIEELDVWVSQNQAFIEKTKISR